MKLPRLEFLDFLEAGEAPREAVGGEAPLEEAAFGDSPLGERPLGGEAPLTNTSSSKGSGTEAKRAEAKTCVGCRKAPPKPLTMRCSGSKGCRLDRPGPGAGDRPVRMGGLW